jgi:hypothetical protein
VAVQVARLLEELEAKLGPAELAVEGRVRRYASLPKAASGLEASRREAERLLRESEAHFERVIAAAEAEIVADPTAGAKAQRAARNAAYAESKVEAARSLLQSAIRAADLVRGVQEAMKAGQATPSTSDLDFIAAIERARGLTEGSP